MQPPMADAAAPAAAAAATVNAALPAAGRRDPTAGQTAGNALTGWGDEHTRPETPEHLKPFQHFSRQPPGRITLRGLPTAGPPPRGKVFGCATKLSGQSVADCLACSPDTELARWQVERQERTYKQQAPLGHAASRHYASMPEGLGTTRPCGRPSRVRVRCARRIRAAAHLTGGGAQAGGKDALGACTHACMADADRAWCAGPLLPATLPVLAAGHAGARGQEQHTQHYLS